MRRIPHNQFLQEAKAQGAPSGMDVAFVCPACGTVQSARSLILARAGKDFDAVGKYMGFSCVGRFRNSGPYIEGKSTPGAGCDWTLGGLLHFHELEVEMPDGHVRMSFELATPDDTKELLGAGGVTFQAAKRESEVAR